MIALAWFIDLPCTLACSLHYGCVMEKIIAKLDNVHCEKNERHDYISKAAIEKHNLIAAAYMELWLKENTKKNSAWSDYKMAG